MEETIQLGEIAIALTRRNVKHVYLSVHPPSGHVTLVAPNGTRSTAARAYAISRLGWIRDQRVKMRGQARETARRFVERESHYLWGRRYLLTVREEDAKPSIRLSHRAIMLTVRPGSDETKRAAVMHDWHKSLLHEAVRELIAKVGAQAGCRGIRLLPATDEDEVGQLQSPRPHHTAQYRTREKAQGSARIRRGSRDAAPLGADAQRAIPGANEQTLPGLARSQGRVLNELPLAAACNGTRLDGEVNRRTAVPAGRLPYRRATICKDGGIILIVAL